MTITKDQKQMEQKITMAYLKGRVDAQRELYPLIRCLEDEIEKLRPKNKRSNKKGVS